MSAADSVESGEDGRMRGHGGGPCRSCAEECGCGFDEPGTGVVREVRDDRRRLVAGVGRGDVRRRSEGSQRAADTVGSVADRGRWHDHRSGADLQRRGVGLSRFEASGIPAWRISLLRCST